MAAAEQHLGKNDHALSVVMQALLALLSHGIDGNSRTHEESKGYLGEIFDQWLRLIAPALFIIGGIYG